MSRKRPTGSQWAFETLQTVDGGLDAGHGAVLAQDLHDGVEVRGSTLAGDGDSQEGADIGNGTGPGFGVLLIELHVGGEAQGLGELLHLIEQGVGIVGGIVGLYKAFQSGTDGGSL